MYSSVSLAFVLIHSSLCTIANRVHHFVSTKWKPAFVFSTIVKEIYACVFILWHWFHDLWNAWYYLRQKRIKTNEWKRKLQLGNDYKHVSSLGKNKLHCSGYFSHPLPLHISHWHSLSRCKSYWEIWLCMLKRHKYRGKNITSRWPYYTQYVTCSSNIAFICHYYHPQLLWVGGILNWQRGPLTKC